MVVKQRDTKQIGCEATDTWKKMMKNKSIQKNLSFIGQELKKLKT